MMDDVTSLEDAAIQRFVEASQEGNLRSTGATLINLSTTPVYNVEGSTTDPKHVPGHIGSLWKPLMITLGISEDAPCYVTDPLPEGDSTHPQFSVGGHVTGNANGQVDTGGTCYLIPLCLWHNSTARDETAFTIPTPRVAVQLTGYMEGELPVTFMLRMPSEHPFALLYRDEDGWRYRDLAQSEAAELQAAESELASAVPGQRSVLVKRIRGETTTHVARPLHPTA